MEKRKRVLEYTSFRGTLRGAICTTPLAEFSYMSKIEPKTLNRMLNAKRIERPDEETLRKIATVAKNGITYKDLEHALNEDDPKFRVRPVSKEKHQEAVGGFHQKFEEIADECLMTLKSSVEDTIKEWRNRICTDLNDFMADVESSYSKRDWHKKGMTYEMSLPKKYYGRLHDDVTHWVYVSVDITNLLETAKTQIIIYLFRTPEGEEKILHADMSSRAIIDLFGYPPKRMDHYLQLGNTQEEALKRVEEEPYVMEIDLVKSNPYRPLSKNTTVEEQVLYSIFGEGIEHFREKEEDYEERIIEGFGFEINGIPSGFGNFCNCHKNTILDAYEPDEMIKLRAALEKLAKNGADNRAYAELFGFDDDLFSWKRIIAHVMEAETGFQFNLIESFAPMCHLPNLSRNDCIMLDRIGISKSGVNDVTLVEVVAKFTKQLGVECFGDIEFHTVRNKRLDGRRVFRNKKILKFEDDEHDEDDVDWIFIDLFGEPEKTGMYHVLLKDGREMDMLFLKRDGGEKNHWIRRHKEWSDMVAAWDATGPVQIQEND